MADSQRQTGDASWTALTARQAEMLSPVFACVDVISSALAALPTARRMRIGELISRTT